MKLAESRSCQLDPFKTIFWDFDGVIKESLEVKANAFSYIFQSFGCKVVNMVVEHHERNGGLSRFVKIPIYLKWSKQDPTEELINNYADKFSRLVKSKVIDSKWVPGVLEYLSNNYKTKNFFLITATPQEEIEDIVSKLDIKHMFKDVIGSPLNKEDAIERILKEYKLPYGNSVMIGDSISDYNGAKFNNVEFILRCTTTNISLQNKLNCRMIKDFL